MSHTAPGQLESKEGKSFLMFMRFVQIKSICLFGHVRLPEESAKVSRLWFVKDVKALVVHFFWQQSRDFFAEGIFHLVWQ